MIREFVVRLQYEDGEELLVGPCGKICASHHRGWSGCKHLVSAKVAADPRKGIQTADLQRYFKVVCATTKKEKVALTLMED